MLLSAYLSESIKYSQKIWIRKGCFFLAEEGDMGYIGFV